MKQWFYKVFTLTVVGMVIYLIFSKDDSLYYHSLGNICWAWYHELGGSRRIENDQGLLKRKWSNEKTGVTLVVFVIILAV